MLGSEILDRQLAIDYSCTVEEIRSNHHVFTQKQFLPGRRMYKDDTSLLKIAIVHDKLVVTCRDEELLDWCRTEYANASAPWFFEFDNIRKLDQKLRTMEEQVADYHHFYLPVESVIEPAPEYDICWYERSELERFRGDSRFREALAFQDQYPDMLAVTAEKLGQILGMAGVSADAQEMWQIGINVMEGSRQKGLGSCLTALLKNEVLKRGKVPYYGTSESHIASQRVAITAGFVPAWAELYSLPL